MTRIRRLTLATFIVCGALGAGSTMARAQTPRPHAILATIPVGNGPNAVAVDTRLARVYVLENARYTPGVVSVLDSKSGAVLHTVEVDQGPQAIAVDAETNHVFVSTTGSAGSINAGAISMIDARNAAFLRRVDVTHPVAMALDEQTHRLFVINMDALSPSGTVLVFDTRSGAIIRTVRIGASSLAITVNTRTRRVFVANFGDGTVSVLDAATGAVLRTVALGPDWPASGDAATSMAVDERAGYVFITTVQSPLLYVLDARTGARVRTVRIEENSLAMAVDESLGRLFITNEGPVDAYGNLLQKGTVRVVDVRTGAIVGTVPVGSFPAAMAVDSVSGRGFVFNMADASVSVLDVRAHSVVATLAIRATRIAGVDPLQQAVAIDDVAGHAFAINIGGTHVTMLDAQGER